MDKQAFNAFDTWERASQHPILGTAKMVGSMFPGIGSAISAGDMLNNLYRGNLASAGLNLVGVGAGLLPGGKLVETLGKGGRLGQAAAKAAPYVSPLAMSAEHAGKVTPYLTSALAQTSAGMLDQARQMKRPTYQKQMREQEQLMSDFADWRRHRQTLQQLSAQTTPTIKEGEAPGLAGSARQLGGVARTVAPYMLAASLGGHVLPSYYQDDLPGMMQGAAIGASGTAGGLAGMVGGGLAGSALGKLLAAHGVNPAILTGLGAVGGGLLGHRLGRSAATNLTTDTDTGRPSLKLGSAKSAGLMDRDYMRDPIGKVKSLLSPGAPDFKTDPLGYAGHQVGRLGGAVGRGVDWLGQKATTLGDPKAGKILGGFSKHIARHPVGYGTAAVAIPSLLALRYMTSSKPEEKQAAKRKPTQGAKTPPRTTEAAESRRAVNREKLTFGEQASQPGGPAAPSTPKPPEPGFERLGPFSKRKLPSPDPGVLPPAPALPAPTAAAPVAAAPGMLSRLQLHPMMQGTSRFIGSPKGQAAILAMLATAGAGAYWAGRRRRQREDQEALAQAG